MATIWMPTYVNHACPTARLVPPMTLRHLYVPPAYQGHFDWTTKPVSQHVLLVSTKAVKLHATHVSSPAPHVIRLQIPVSHVYRTRKLPYTSRELNV